MKVFAVLRLCLMAWCLGAWALVSGAVLTPATARPLPEPAVTSAAFQRDLAMLPPVALALDRSNRLDHTVVAPGADSPPGLNSAWMKVNLPHRWAVTHGAYEGSMWYRFRITLKAVPGEAWAVYMPRVNMNGQVWINGVPMAFDGRLTEPVTRNWYTPQLVKVPHGTWKVGDNDIYIHVVSGYLSRNGLSAVDVGPLRLLEHDHNLRRLAQNDAPRIADTSLIALGLFMVLVWLRDRSQDAIALQGMAAILWGIGNMMSTAQEVFLPLFIWESLGFVFVVTSQLLICLFFWRFVGRRVRAIDYSIYMLLVATPILTFFWPSGPQIVLTYLAILILMAISSTQALIHVVRTRRPDGWVLVAGCVLAVPVAVHDFAFIANWLAYDSFYWLAFAGPVLMYCTFYILAGDHARSRQDLAHLNATLASQVAEREAALRDSFQRLAELERAQAVQAERSRILRDMHDGVGAHLSSALRQLQAGRQQPVDLNLVIQTLRDSLDQLKLSVDALTLAPGDVVGLLASLRFRIAPRLRAAGLELIWNVQDLPTWPAGQPPALRQLQYILFEGLSNVLQHSGATRLTLSARHRAGDIEVMLSDDGCGWSGEGEGTGIQTMRARAKVIGAQLDLTGTPGRGTELRIVLPLVQREQLDLSSAA